MTNPKMKPCPRCLDGGDPVVMIYEYGWRRVECLDCDYPGPGKGNAKQAIQSWNEQVGDHP